MARSVFFVGTNVTAELWEVIDRAAKERRMSVSNLIRAGLRATGVPVPPSNPNGRPPKRPVPAPRPVSTQAPTLSEPRHRARTTPGPHAAAAPAAA